MVAFIAAWRKSFLYGADSLPVKWPAGYYRTPIGTPDNALECSKNKESLDIVIRRLIKVKRLIFLLMFPLIN